MKEKQSRRLRTWLLCTCLLLSLLLGLTACGSSSGYEGHLAVDRGRRRDPNGAGRERPGPLLRSGIPECFTQVSGRRPRTALM